MKRPTLTTLEQTHVRRMELAGWHLDWSPTCGAWSFRHDRGWITGLCDKDGKVVYRTIDLALAAAERIEQGVKATEAAQQARVAELRAYFAQDERKKAA